MGTAAALINPFAATAEAAALTTVYNSAMATHRAVVGANQTATPSREPVEWRSHAHGSDSVTIHHGPLAPRVGGDSAEQRRLMLVHQTRYETDWRPNYQREGDPTSGYGVRIADHSFYVGFTHKSPDEAETSVVVLAELPSHIQGALVPTKLQAVNANAGLGHVTYVHASGMKNEDGGYVLLNLDGSANVTENTIALQFMGGKVMMQVGPDARNRIELTPLPARTETDPRSSNRGIDIPQAYAPSYNVPPIKFWGLLTGEAHITNITLATGIRVLRDGFVYRPVR